MAYFPSQLQNPPQVLWLPVVVQQLHNQTVQQLRRQNDFLKHQLSEVLKTEKIGPSFQCTSHQFTQSSHRDSFCPQNNGYSTIRPVKNACISPKFQPYDRRLSFNHPTGLMPYFSPKQANQVSKIKQNIFEESTKLRRMVISKGKDGKLYRDLCKKNQQNQLSQNNKTLNKFSTAQSSLIFSALATPTRKSKEMLKSAIQLKPTTKRLKSPNFLKKDLRPENTENDKYRTSLIAHLKQQLTIQQARPVFKRSHQVQQSIIESQEQYQSQKQEIKQIQQACKVYIQQSKVERNQCRVPTLQLSYQCDSNLSIERILRQAKRQKTPKKLSNCDHFLKQIEKNLDAMYGNHQNR